MDDNETPTIQQKDLRSGQIDNSSDEQHQISCSGRKRAHLDSELSSKEITAKKQKPNTPATEEMNSFADLPNEMLDMILKMVASSDLLNCRGVNKLWNKTSCRIMASREDFTLHFAWMGEKFVHKIHPHEQCGRMTTKSLDDFVNSMQHFMQDTGVSFPFTAYEFFVLNKGYKDLREFFTRFGKEIRWLKLYITDSKECGDIVREIVFKNAPNLKKLEIENSQYSNHRQRPRLPTQSMENMQLPKMEILIVDDLYPEILEVVLTAATNIKTISIKSCIKVEQFQMLERTGKLHCLKDAKILVDEQFIAYWPNCGPLQLQSLNLKLGNSIYEDQQLQLKATTTINQLLLSIKDTLHSLTNEPLGILTGLEIPKFGQLKKLWIQNYDSDFGDFDMTPPQPSLFDWNTTCPNLKELEISFEYGFIDSTFYQSFQSSETIETLRIWCDDARAIEELMKLTPNVKTLSIEDHAYMRSYNEVDSIFSFRDISKWLPKLENFIWQIYIGANNLTHGPFMHKMDATITGLPVDLCQKLTEKFRNNDDLSAATVAKYDAKRCRPSILDLKELKRLDIDYSIYKIMNKPGELNDGDSQLMDEAGFGPECDLYQSGFTKVSKFLGFDLIPNVKVVIRKSIYNIAGAFLGFED